MTFLWTADSLQFFSVLNALQEGQQGPQVDLQPRSIGFEDSQDGSSLASMNGDGGPAAGNDGEFVTTRTDAYHAAETS